jgi:hypothetical protein
LYCCLSVKICAGYETCNAAINNGSKKKRSNNGDAMIVR